MVFVDEAVTNRDSSTHIGRMLQRPPPLIRILRPPSMVDSSSSVSAPADAENIAAIAPAAPAPITATRRRVPPHPDNSSQAHVTAFDGSRAAVAIDSGFLDTGGTERWRMKRMIDDRVTGS